MTGLGILWLLIGPQWSQAGLFLWDQLTRPPSDSRACCLCKLTLNNSIPVNRWYFASRTPREIKERRWRTWSSAGRAAPIFPLFCSEVSRSKQLQMRCCANGAPLRRRRRCVLSDDFISIYRFLLLMLGTRAACSGFWNLAGVGAGVPQASHCLLTTERNVSVASCEQMAQINRSKAAVWLANAQLCCRTRRVA